MFVDWKKTKWLHQAASFFRKNSHLSRRKTPFFVEAKILVPCWQYLPLAPVLNYISSSPSFSTYFFNIPFSIDLPCSSKESPPLRHSIWSFVCVFHLPCIQNVPPMSPFFILSPSSSLQSTNYYIYIYTHTHKVPINFKIEKKNIGKPKKSCSDYVKNNV